MFEKNTNIRWINEDGIHLGVVLSYAGGMVEFETEYGIMCVSEDDGEFETYGRRLDFTPVRAAEKPSKPPVKRAEKPSKSAKISPKVQMVIDLLHTSKPLSRKDAIAMIVAAGISTTAGASTHYNTAKKFI